LVENEVMEDGAAAGYVYVMREFLRVNYPARHCTGFFYA
jgi:hypothetical protein